MAMAVVGLTPTQLSRLWNYTIETWNRATFYAKASTKMIICTNKIKTLQLTIKMERNWLMQLVGRKESEEIVTVTTTTTTITTTTTTTLTTDADQ